MHIYEQLWNEAVTALGAGKPRLDPHLLDKANDQRRGVSLIFRLPTSVQDRIQQFVDELAVNFSGQYFYQPEELHVTVVTLISATQLWQQEMGDVEAFRGILAEVLAHHRRFKLEFRGATAASNAVLVQGFPTDEALEKIRADLRREFVQRGFPNRLDRRYVNSAAHVTTMRFRRSDGDWPQLLETVKANRQTAFGEMEVEALELIWCDWYASADKTKLLQKYPLALNQA
jgi:2'-5' RNA ligase